MKTDLYVGKHFSLHFTCINKQCFEFNVLPSITINAWRVLVSFLCFSIQYSFEEIDKDMWQ